MKVKTNVKAGQFSLSISAYAAGYQSQYQEQVAAAAIVIEAGSE